MGFGLWALGRRLRKNDPRRIRFITLVQSHRVGLVHARLHLRVWKQAHQLRLGIHAATKAFPADERFGLTSQVRRSSASVSSNIAESCGYSGGADSARFIQYAVGSCCETLNHLIAAKDLGYLTAELFARFEQALEAVRRGLLRLLKRMRE